MEINESFIRFLIAKVIEKMTEAESSEKPKVYVVLNEALKFPFALFEQLHNQQNFDIIILLPECLSHENFIHIFPEKTNFKFVIQSQVTEFPKGKFENLIPILDKTSIAKIAMGISDTFTTKWIENCFEQGQEINLLKSGIQVLSGKEPLAYQRRFKNYIEILSEYKIKVIDELSELNPLSYDIKVEDFQEEEKKRIITYQDIFNYQETRKIILRSQDIITDLAKEKAKELGISLYFR